MKKNIFSLAAILAIGTFSAQVRTVNSATNVSVTNSPAFIDASSNTTVNGSSNIGKGLIFPRVDLSAMTAFPGVTAGIPNSFPTRFDGMIVYNTASSGTAGVGSTQGTLTPGYWYYENKTSSNTGGTWKPVSTAAAGVANTASNGLSLSGNDVKLGGTLSQATDIATAGNNLTISGTGNVGIGNASPSFKLDVQGTSAGTVTSRIYGASTNGAAELRLDNQNATNGKTYSLLSTGTSNTGGPGFFQIYDINAGASRIAVNGDGMVGIGNTAPVYNLDVLGAGSGSAVTRIQSNNANGAAELRLDNQNATNGKTYSLISTGPASNGGSGFFQIYDVNAGASRVTVNGSGMVGIGTSAPTAKLEINNGTTAGAIKITDGTQGAGKVLTSDANGLASWTNTVTTAFANAWSSYTGTLGNPFGGTTGGSGLATGISVTIPAKGWYFFRSGITIASLCNDYSFYISGIGDVWRTYCGSSSSSGEIMVPRDQTRVLYFASPGTYTILAAKTNGNVPSFYNSGNPSFYLDFVKFQN